MSDQPQQCALPFRTWGGRRSGAGRKPTGPTAGVPHRRRPLHHGRHPVHVTLRVVRGLPSLRSRELFAALRGDLAAASAPPFRVVHFSVQANHVHLLVEAEGIRVLGRGMQGLGIRLAKAINRRLGRKGRVWEDRYHGRPLRTPREVRHGLAYVLLNARKHGVHGPGDRSMLLGSLVRGMAKRRRDAARAGAGCAAADVALERGLAAEWFDRHRRCACEDRDAEERSGRPCNPSTITCS